MALFKIKKGLRANLPKTYNEGYCYFTTDDGKMYIDTTDTSSGRVCLNAAKADTLTVANKGSATNPVYFVDGIPTECGFIISDYLPKSAGADHKITGPLGFTEGVNYGTTLPSTGFDGQLFFLEDDTPSLPLGGEAGHVLIKNSDVDGDASWKELVALPKGGGTG